MIRSTNSDRRKRLKKAPPEFSREVQIAISEGVTQGDPITELEYLGLSIRTINLLENSRYQLTTLEDLVRLQRDDLLEIPNFGAHGLDELLQCLSRYDQLEDIKRRIDSSLQSGRAPWNVNEFEN